MTMSNRIDVTTSPGRTTMAEKDDKILEGIDSPFRGLVGDQLTDRLTAITMSPGGNHITSSKQLDASEDSGSSTGSKGFVGSSL